MNIGSIILFVKDMQTVTVFYRDVIGLQPDEEQPFLVPLFFAWLI